MWRALFTAIAICLLILGAEFLIVDNAVLALPQRKAAPTSPFEPPPPQGPKTRQISPPEWAPWTLLSAGAVVLLYTITLSRNSE